MLIFTYNLKQNKMNIGTMGAAVIMSNNHTNRMMRGGYGGGSSNDEPEESSRFLLVFNIIALVVLISTWAFNTQPEFWYIDVDQTIVEKSMLTEKGSKGKTYDSPFVKVETHYVEVNNGAYGEWVQTDSTLWVKCKQKDYLNYQIGSVIVTTIVNPELQGWSTLFTWITWISLFLLICGISMSMANHMP